MCVGGVGCVEVPLSWSLYVWCVCRGEPNLGSEATQVTILAIYQCTNTPTTLQHSKRGVGGSWVY